MSGVALDHLVGWLEASVGDLGNTKLLVVGLKEIEVIIRSTL